MNVFVGCASRNTSNETFNKTAEELGNFIVDHGHNFVFGGCDRGLMGRIYTSIIQKKSQSEIIVVMAKAYEDDLKTLSYNKVYTFDAVNERKNAVISLSDVLVFIPGGIGTIDELMTAIEAKRSHEHDKPILIVNVDNFFGNLLDMLNEIYSEGFADLKNRKLYFVANSIDEAIEYLATLE